MNAQTPNRIVSPPVSNENVPAISARIRQLDFPLAENPETGWQQYPIFGGSTANLRKITCHASALSAGKCPHPPHAHVSEELLIMLGGEADLVIKDGESLRKHRVRRGHFAYYPSSWTHTIESAGTVAANYLMFKWEGDAEEGPKKMTHEIFDATTQFPSDGESAFRVKGVFNGSTRFLRRLHCHTSSVAPGGGYDPHVDAHDVAIVVFEGEIETCGERIGPNGVAFYAAGTPHGLRNPGDTPARYLVFEFHRAGWVAPSQWSLAKRAAGKGLRRIKSGIGSAFPVLRRLKQLVS